MSGGVVSGGGTKTENWRVSGVASTLLAASRARTEMLWFPLPRLRVSLPVVPGPGELHGA